jgi:hypothetical protein
MAPSIAHAENIDSERRKISPDRFARSNTPAGKRAVSYSPARSMKSGPMPGKSRD